MLRRIALAVTGLILAAVLVAAGALYYFMSGDGVRQALERQATAWLGQPVRIASASAQILPRPAIALGDVRVGEAEGAE